MNNLHSLHVGLLVVTVIIGRVTQLVQAEVEIVYDSLCITDEQSYRSRIVNLCGGEAIVGEPYDAQAAGSFMTTRPYLMTRVTGDFLTYLGYCPAKLCVAFYHYDDNHQRPCMAENEAYCYSEVLDDGVTCESFDDTVFNHEGVRMRGDMPAACYLPAGEWFMSIQPSSGDFSMQVLQTGDPRCTEALCKVNYRDGGDRNPCCDGRGGYGGSFDWYSDGSFQEWTLAMRVEGIPAGDCTDGEIVSASCKVRDGGRRGRVVVKVGNGQPNGTVTALLDPPDPQSISIALDGSGRGKGKFRGVPLGEHRVFVCDSIVDVACAP